MLPVGKNHFLEDSFNPAVFDFSCYKNNLFIAVKNLIILKNLIEIKENSAVILTERALIYIIKTQILARIVAARKRRACPMQRIAEPRKAGGDSKSCSRNLFFLF